MKLIKPTTRRVLTTLAVVVTVAAAAVVWQNLPTPTDVLGPFEVHGEAGTPVTGRAVSATVTGVRVSPDVNGTKPAGIWVVVDTAVEGTVSTELPHSKLIAGPNTYTPSDVFSLDTLGGVMINPELTLSGSYVFDVVPALVAPDAKGPLVFQLWVGDSRLDSLLVIRIPIDDQWVHRVDQVTLERPEVTAS